MVPVSCPPLSTLFRPTKDGGETCPFSPRPSMKEWVGTTRYPFTIEGMWQSWEWAWPDYAVGEDCVSCPAEAIIAPLVHSVP